MRTMRKQAAKGLLLLAAGLTLSACTDDNYDLDKDIDMTMMLGSEGVQMKLGTTEKIMLGDLLEVDDEELFGKDENGLFYLTMKDNADFRFTVNPVTIKVNKATLCPEVEVINIDRMGIGQLPVSSVSHVHTVGQVRAYDTFDLDVSDIKEDVERIRRIMPTNNSSRFALTLKIVQKGSSFNFKSVKNLKIFFPDFVMLEEIANNQYKYKVTHEADGSSVLEFDPNVDIANGSREVKLGYVTLNSIYLDDATGKGKPVVVENGERVLKHSGDLCMEGEFALGVDRTFTMHGGDYADIRLEINLEGEQDTQNPDKILLDLDKVEGVFCPEIEEPSIGTISLGNDLPDFLRNEEVRIDVANPTIKFEVNMTEIPISLQFKGTMTGSGYPGGEPAKTVSIHAGENAATQETDFVTLFKESERFVYFYDKQGDEGRLQDPYDPVREIDKDKDDIIDVRGLADLVEVLPEKIDVNLTPVQVLRDELCTIRLDETYDAFVNYDILFPFMVNSKMKVVYNDSITGLHDDLEDYEAGGLIVSADMANTIPLELIASIIPVDYNGRVMEDVRVEPAVVEPGNTGREVVSPIEIRLTFSNPADLKKLDMLRFKVNASADKNATEASRFVSDQYLQVRDLRLKLAGAIVADFN